MTQVANNIIYTGVAGTGKTHQLQQLAKAYTQSLPPIDKHLLLRTLVEQLSWREVICLVFLQKRQQGQELVKVVEIVEHEFFQTKANLNARVDNLKNTVWANLQTYSNPNSTTVSCAKRASQAYFDKDSSSSWYLLDETLPLLDELQRQLASLQQSLYQHHPVHTSESASPASETGLNPSVKHINQSIKQPVNQTVNQKMKQKRYTMVSFHQAYGYDEFVEGIRPVVDAQTGQMRYQIQDGAFVQLCQQASRDPNHRYAMLIDEINRANVMQVFGELMSLIEPSKRLGQANAMQVRLAYSGREFGVPANVDIYATMNTQDHSLVQLDSAFRRRFTFVDMLPDASVLTPINDVNGQKIELGKVLAGINQRLLQHVGNQAMLGHAYFCGVANMAELLQVMARQVLPQLMSVTQHHPQVLAQVLRLDQCDWLINSQALFATEQNPNTAKLSRGYFADASATQTYCLHPELLAVLAQIDAMQTDMQKNASDLNSSDVNIDINTRGVNSEITTIETIIEAVTETITATDASQINQIPMTNEHKKHKWYQWQDSKFAQHTMFTGLY